MSLPPDTLTVLAACRDALRSFQHGTAAPDLAHAVADEADRILGRPSLDRPSLTPSEDSTRAMLRTLPRLADHAAPGQAGVRARIALAMAEARVLAIARELDRGATNAEVVVAFADATSDEIAVVAAGASDDPLGLARSLISGIALKTGIAVGRLARGETPLGTAEMHRMPRA